MARRFAKQIIALSALAASGTALACAGGDDCGGHFSLGGSELTCEGGAMLSPSNDSRLNLMMLMGDRGGMNLGNLAPPKRDYGNFVYSGLGLPYLDSSSVYLDWPTLRLALYPQESNPQMAPDYAGSRCQSYASGGAALARAMAANKELPAVELAVLATVRAQAEEVCRTGAANDRTWDKDAKKPLTAFGQWPSVSSAPGREFLGYMQAADAFYGERFDQARQGFAALASAGDPWVRETAAYMLIRVEFAAAQAGAFTDYGSFEPGEKVDRAAARRGLQALAAYLKAWPNGRYAQSAAGLVRRGLWLTGDYALLGKTYARLLENAPLTKPAAADLVEEVDLKLLFNRDAGNAGREGAMLLASHDLVAMRNTEWEDGKPPKPGISATELDAQAPAFAGQPELFSYLQATHAFHYAKDYRRVLQLIPDDARQPVYSNLAFSRQMLRGMALAALKDRNEGGFWQELLGGAKGGWQRPLVELGLAMNWERSGKVDAVFATGSPIRNPALRATLIDNSAGPALLRSITRNGANPADERDHALYVLLAQQLVRGQYAAFGADVKLPVLGKEAEARAFTSGKVSDGYPCAALAVTVAALAKNPQDIAGRLCLGDFFRLHGLDYMGGKWDTGPDKDSLGGYAVGFPGKRNFRSEFYTAIIADPGAGANDKAYALYRAVMCYAPSGNNDCGGEDVSKSQRKAWFDRLKRDYPQSVWAKKLRYYW